MGGLLDRLDARKAGEVTPCIVGRALAAMTEADRADMVQALDLPEYTNPVLIEEFVAQGHSFVASTLSLHRRHKCGCHGRSD